MKKFIQFTTLLIFGFAALSSVAEAHASKKKHSHKKHQEHKSNSAKPAETHHMSIEKSRIIS